MIREWRTPHTYQVKPGFCGVLIYHILFKPQFVQTVQGIEPRLKLM